MHYDVNCTRTVQYSTVLILSRTHILYYSLLNIKQQQSFFWLIIYSITQVLYRTCPYCSGTVLYIQHIYINKIR